MGLPETAKQIEDSRDYIDVDGSVWAFDARTGRKNSGKWYKKVQEHVHGYLYCGIYRVSLQRNVSMRVHRLVAKAFIENDAPEIKTYVAHKNNIKDDNRVENLYWATPSENTQQAVDDGLLINDKGTDDSQSIPVRQYRTRTNEFIAEYGSAKEAERITGISATTILRQCRYNRPVRKSTYFRFLGDESIASNEPIFAYDTTTDLKLGIFFNIVDAAREFGLSPKVVSYDLHNNRKPRYNLNRRNVYFLHRNIASNIESEHKCESTIETPKGQ